MWELRQPIPISEGAANIEANQNNARRRRVRVPAGCGKSFGLAARAARLASEGKNVLVLSLNVTLSHYLRALVASHCATYASNPARVTCVPIHAFSGRVVEDTKAQGIKPAEVEKVPPWDEVIAKAASVLQQGHRCRYDAVLVDEGQDFELAWWQMLRDHVVAPDGEMLLVADPTQDIFNKQAWTDEERMIGSGFSGQWTDLAGSYRCRQTWSRSPMHLPSAISVARDWPQPSRQTALRSAAPRLAPSAGGRTSRRPPIRTRSRTANGRSAPSQSRAMSERHGLHVRNPPPGFGSGEASKRAASPCTTCSLRTTARGSVASAASGPMHRASGAAPLIRSKDGSPEPSCSASAPGLGDPAPGLCGNDAGEGRPPRPSIAGDRRQLRPRLGSL